MGKWLKSLVLLPQAFEESRWTFGAQVSWASLRTIKLAQRWTNEGGKRASCKLHAEMDHVTFVRPARIRYFHYTTQNTSAWGCHAVHRTHAPCALRSFLPQCTALTKVVSLKADTGPSNKLARSVAVFLNGFWGWETVQVHVLMKVLYDLISLFDLLVFR